MDALTFVAAVIDSLAWPATLLASLFLLRKPLARVLPMLRRVRYKDVDVEFGVASEVKGELVKEAARELETTTHPKQQAIQQATQQADEERAFTRLVLDALVSPKGPLRNGKVRADVRISFGDIVMYADAVIEVGWVTYVVDVKLPRNEEAVVRATEAASRNAQAFSLYLAREKGIRWFVKPLVVVPTGSFKEDKTPHASVLKFDATTKDFTNAGQAITSDLMSAFLSEPHR